MKNLIFISLLIISSSSMIKAQSIQYSAFADLGFLIGDVSIPGHIALGGGVIYKGHFGGGVEYRLASANDSMRGVGGYLGYIHKYFLVKGSIGKVLSGGIYNDYGNIEEYISGGLYYSVSGAFKFPFGLYLGVDFTSASDMHFKVVDNTTNELRYFSNNFTTTTPMIGYIYVF